MIARRYIFAIHVIRKTAILPASRNVRPKVLNIEGNTVFHRKRIDVKALFRKLFKLMKSFRNIKDFGLFFQLSSLLLLF